MRGMGNGEEAILHHVAGCHMKNRSSVAAFYRAVRESGIVPNDSALVGALAEVDEASRGYDDIPT